MTLQHRLLTAVVETLASQSLSPFRDFAQDLTGGTIDVLKQCYKNPVWDGDIVSKSARDDLIEAGLVKRDRQGYSRATAMGKYVLSIRAGMKPRKPTLRPLAWGEGTQGFTCSDGTITGVGETPEQAYKQLYSKLGILKLLEEADDNPYPTLILLVEDRAKIKSALSLLNDAMANMEGYLSEPNYHINWEGRFMVRNGQKYRDMFSVKLNRYRSR